MLIFVIREPEHLSGSLQCKRYAIRNWMLRNNVPYKFIHPKQANEPWRIRINDDMDAMLCCLEVGCHLIPEENFTE